VSGARLERVIISRQFQDPSEGEELKTITSRACFLLTTFEEPLVNLLCAAFCQSEHEATEILESPRVHSSPAKAL
jgi:hypothetical protein